MDKGWEHWVQVLAVPILGAAGRLAWPTPGRRARKHFDLYEKTPEELREPLRELIEADLADYARREKAKIGRRLSGSTIAALIFVALVGGAGTYGLWLVDNTAVRVIAILFGAFVVALLLAGLNQLYEPTSKQKVDGVPG